MIKKLFCGSLLVIVSIVLGSEKKALVFSQKINPHHGHEIRIGNKTIDSSVLASIKKKDKERLEKIANPSLLAVCCAGVSNQRIMEADIPVIRKIAHKPESAALRKVMDGMVVKTINTEDSCCLNASCTNSQQTKCLGSSLFGVCMTLPFVIAGSFGSVASCIVAAPVGIGSGLGMCCCIECAQCGYYHRCSKTKTYDFVFDQNEISESV